MQTKGYDVRDVSRVMFHYHLKDLRTLRNKYFRLFQASPGVGKVSKDFIVTSIARHELGDKVVDEYLAMVKQQKEFEALAGEQDWHEEEEYQ